MLCSVPVTFSAPASGASSVFASGTSVAVVSTDALGFAAVSATANSTPGSYGVTASATGYGTATFALTNTGGTISYNTTGTTLACNGVAGCVQNTSTSVTVSGLTLTYNAGSGSGVIVPSILNLGNVVSTGTSTGANVSGLRLDINVNSTPPGGSGVLPPGAFSGNIATSKSSGSVNFSPNNVTTAFGTLPGVFISGGGQSFAGCVDWSKIDCPGQVAGGLPQNLVCGFHHWAKSRTRALVVSGDRQR